MSETWTRRCWAGRRVTLAAIVSDDQRTSSAAWLRVGTTSPISAAVLSTCLSVRGTACQSPAQAASFQHDTSIR